MIYLDPDPRRPHVHAASLQMAMVRDYMRAISCADGDSRLYMLAMIRPCFAALRWLQAERFADRAQIASLIDDTEQKAEELAYLGQGEVNWTSGMSPRVRCPVCGQKLTATLGKPECSACVQVAISAYHRLASSFEGFGTESI